MSAPPPPAPAPEPPLTGSSALVVNLIRFINSLTNERLLLLVVVSLLSYLMFTTLKAQGEREAYQARLYEESRVEERRHCDSREEKMRLELTTFFAGQSEIQRKYDTNRDDLLQQRFGERTEALRTMLIALTSRLSELERLIRAKMP